MSDIKEFINKSKPQFKKWETYLKDNDWTEYSTQKPPRPNEFKTRDEEQLWTMEYKSLKDNFDIRERQFDTEVGVVKNILSRLTFFIKKAKGDYKDKDFKRFFKYCTGLVKIHIDRCDNYNAESDISNSINEQEEINFQSKVFTQFSKVDDSINEFGFVDDDTKTRDLIEFYESKKASIAVYTEVIRDYPFVRQKMKDMKIDFDSSPPATIHILNENPPIWDGDKHFWEQDKKTLQYYLDEYKKIEYGIEIDGYFFDGWLYFHFNHFVTSIPTTEVVNGIPRNKDVAMVAPLRDNEVIMTDYFLKAEREQLWALIAATRRAAKTTLNASRVERAKLIGKKQILVVGGSTTDLAHIDRNCNVHQDNCNTAFKSYDLGENTEDKRGKDWGIRTKDNKRKRHATVFLLNLEAGVKTTKKEFLAGFTPDEFILDEAFKFHFLESISPIRAALKGKGIMRVTPVLTACVCAGTKVWNNNGDFINIEDLTTEQGILGFNQETEQISKENIPWMQPPMDKDCFRITTHTGRILECSYDHPILKKHRDKIDYSKGRKNGFRAMTFEETHTLKVGDNIATIEEVPFYGDKVMWHPRLIGLLIGDGTYGIDKTPKLSNCDEDVNKYIDDNFDTVVERGYITKDGRYYRETRIRSITKELRKLGIFGQVKTDKTLPIDIHSYRKEDICEMIGGLFDADGCVHIGKTNMSVSITFSGLNLVTELQFLLQKLGVHSIIQKEMPRESSFGSNPYYRLSVLDKNSIETFQKNITFLIKYKQEKLDEICEKLKDRKSGTNQKNLKGLRFERVKSLEYIGKKPVYNLTAGVTNTYIANGIVTHNTAGTDELAADGIKVLSHPNSYDIALMDWDSLERGVPKEHVTWNRVPFGMFLPGQMSIFYRNGYEVSFTEYLGKSSDSMPTLSKLKIEVTDWLKSKTALLLDKEKKSHDMKEFVKLCAYHPMDTVDMFLSGKESPFTPCLMEAKAHKKRLLDTGLWDARKEVFRDSGVIKIEPSTRELLPYPFKGVSDAPFLIFEIPPPSEQIPYGMYTAGFDDYKQDDSDSDSVATFYVWKNEMLGDTHSKKIVASISVRPKDHKRVYEKWLLLMELFNLRETCFGENEDFAIKDYLDTRHLTDKYLAQSLDFTQSFTISNNTKRKFGWTPRTTKRFLFDLFVDYCNEEVEIELEDGSFITKKGVEKIDDIYLLDEIIQYSENANVDRIISAMGGFGYLHYLKASYKWSPTKTFKKRMDSEKEEKKQFKRGFYANDLRGFYGSKRVGKQR